MPKSASRTAAVEHAVPAPDAENNARAGPDDPAGYVTREAEPVAKGKKGTHRKASRKSARASAKPGPSAKKARRPSRKTFLVAVTRVGADGASVLQVYAAMTRSPAEALAATRAALGPEVAVELTGKLSNRMAKSLGLKPDEVRPI